MDFDIANNTETTHELSVSPHVPTERVKIAVPGITSPADVASCVPLAWQTAQKVGFQHPLIQVRAVLPVSQKDDLLAAVAERGAEVNGEIRLLHSETPHAIYYIQKEDPRRLRYQFQNPDKDITHEEALQRAGARGITIYTSDLNYHIETFHPSGVSSVTGREMDTAMLAEELVDSHQRCFAYAHDSAQQDVNSVHGIIENNPLVVAFRRDGRVAAVGLMERDEKFTGLPDLRVYEPTFWTLPEDRRKGLSIGLRQAMMALVDCMGKTIFYSESVRPTSFQTSLRAGCRYGGNLGDAYTAIGPANPESGLMPMGLTYYTSRDITIY